MFSVRIELGGGGDFFCPHENEKPAFSNSLGFKSDIKKLRFRDGFVIDGRSNQSNKAPFSNCSA